MGKIASLSSSLSRSLSLSSLLFSLSPSLSLSLVLFLFLFLFLESQPTKGHQGVVPHGENSFVVGHTHVHIAQLPRDESPAVHFFLFSLPLTLPPSNSLTLSHSTWCSRKSQPTKDHQASGPPWGKQLRCRAHARSHRAVAEK
jgi:hypothetical protein